MFIWKQYLSVIIMKYRCTICGYVYDENKGEPGKGINPETRFAKLPEGWRCPLCGTPKSKFVM